MFGIVFKFYVYLWSMTYKLQSASLTEGVNFLKKIVLLQL